jgi:hypothetical protein
LRIEEYCWSYLPRSCGGRLSRSCRYSASAAAHVPGGASPLVCIKEELLHRIGGVAASSDLVAHPAGLLGCFHQLEAGDAGVLIYQPLNGRPALRAVGHVEGDVGQLGLEGLQPHLLGALLLLPDHLAVLVARFQHFQAEHLGNRSPLPVLADGPTAEALPMIRASSD